MTEEAFRKYNGETPPQSRTANGIWDVMHNATKNAISSIRGKEFEKLLAVANPANGIDFLDEVSYYGFLCSIDFGILYEGFSLFLPSNSLINKHFGDHSELTMTLEKLQMIATASVESIFKFKWWRWWNSSNMSRESLRFPLGDIKEKELEKWLIKASFWVQVFHHPQMSKCFHFKKIKFYDLFYSCDVYVSFCSWKMVL